jgi:hypothetical protein
MPTIFAVAVIISAFHSGSFIERDPIFEKFDLTNFAKIEHKLMAELNDQVLFIQSNGDNGDDIKMTTLSNGLTVSLILVCLFVCVWCVCNNYKLLLFL